MALEDKSTEMLVGLLLEDERRGADAIDIEVNADFDSVGDPDKRDAAIHAERFSIERHGASNIGATISFAGASKGQGLGLGNAANRECSRKVKRERAGLHNF